MQRFKPSEQREGDLINGRIDALRLYSSAYLWEFLASRNALHLDRFRPIAGRSGSRQLYDAEMDRWEGEE